MRVEATTLSPFATEADTIAIGVFAQDTPLRAELSALVASGEAKSSFGHLALTHLDGRRVLLAGLGPHGDFDAERARVIAALAGRRARELSARALCWELPSPSPPATDKIAEAIVQGTLLGAYRFERYRPDSPPQTLGRLVVSSPPDVSAAVDRATLITAAQNRARDLVNRPANDLTPTALADYAQQLAGRHESVSFAALHGDAIRELGMGAFAAVAQGSDQDARLIELSYEPVSSSEPTQRLALIGKGVTFDSGGLWLKSNASLIGMKFDMAGGAAVIEAVGALAELGAPVRVLGIVGATENMISGRAVRPGDIVTALDGTTIEINNPDAEGRLVLADCITYARRLGCDAIVDIATLTAGPGIALGSTYAGFMANDEPLAESMTACAQRTGELVWRLPLHPDYAEMIKGRYAQLTNRSERREAMSSTAAELLHHFAGDVPWAHLDIANMSDDVPVPYLGKGATGFGVRLLTELAVSLNSD